MLEGTAAATEPAQQQDAEVLVLMPNGQAELDMQTYLTGVLLAEMPVDFSEEALKAQAVVSRTYDESKTSDARRY